MVWEPSGLDFLLGGLEVHIPTLLAKELKVFYIVQISDWKQLLLL